MGVLLLAILGAMLVIVSLGVISQKLKSAGNHLLGNFTSALIVVFTIIGVVLFNKKFNKIGPDQYGFHFKKIGKSFAIGFNTALLIIVLVLLVACCIFGVQLRWLGLYDNFQTPLMLSVLATFAIAVWEEVFFRGLLFTTLHNHKFGFQKSAIISTALFSLVHWSSFDMQTTSWLWYLGIGLIGYLLAVLYLYTRSIWTPVFFHFAWNFLVDLMVDSENEIGIFSIKDYKEDAILIDNIEVFFLGVASIVIFSLRHKISGFTLK